MTEFTPTLLGTVFVDEDGNRGMITDETETDVFIETPDFTGWCGKAFFLSLIEDE